MRSIVSCGSFYAATTAFAALASAAAPTVTFGAASNYKSVASITASPSDRDLLILPTQTSKGVVPTQGLDFYLGPKLQTAIDGTLRTVCAKGPSSDCTDALVEELSRNNEYGLVARSAGLAQVASGLAALALALYWGHQADPKATISAIHMASTDVAQIQSQTAAPYVFVTPSATAPITVAATKTPTIAKGSAAIATLTADQNGNHKGDVIINLAREPAQLLYQLIDKASDHGKCHNKTTSKRGTSGVGVVNYDAINTISWLVLGATAPGQMLDGLGLEVRQALPRLRLELAQYSLSLTQGAAATLVEFQGVDPALTKVISQMLWLAVYEYCANAVKDFAQIKVEEWATDDPADEKKKCPADKAEAPICDDPDCAGKNNKCTSGNKRECKCLNLVTPHIELGDRATWDAGQQVIDAMLGGSGGGGAAKPNCIGTANNKYVATTFLKSTITVFCDVAAAQGIHDRDAASIQRTYGDDKTGKLSLAIDWPPGDSFKPNKDECVTQMNAIWEGCDESSDVPNPIHWKHGGSVLIDNKVKYNVNPLSEHYAGGMCAFHLFEREIIAKDEGQPRWRLSVQIKDGKDKLISDTDKGATKDGVGVDEGNSYDYFELYTPLKMAPKGKAPDGTIEFTFGSLKWTTNDKDGQGRCNTGKWDSDKMIGAIGRNMDCFFPC